MVEQIKLLIKWMPGVTIERMKEGYSKIRNRALAHAFSYLNLVEAWGSGIPKLIHAMEEYGLPDPEFIDMEIGFRINLYRKEVSDIEEMPDTAEKVPDTAEKVPDTTGEVPDTAEKVPDTTEKVPDTIEEVPDTAEKMPDTTEEVPEQEKRIREYVLVNGYITSAQAEILLKVKQRRSRVVLNDMVKAGVLKKVGVARSTKYILSEDGKGQI